MEQSKHDQNLPKSSEKPKDLKEPEFEPNLNEIDPDGDIDEKAPPN